MSSEETSTTAQGEATAGGYEKPKGSVREHNLSPLNDAESAADGANIDLLMDVSVPVTAQLGATNMRIREILKLGPGSIVELEKLAGEPVDLLVRGQIFAQGEVVVVDDNFGIRVTKIVSQPSRADRTGA